VEGEEQDGGGEVDQSVAEVEIEYLNFEEDIGPPHFLALVLRHFLLNLLEGVIAAIDPSFSLSHQSINGLYGIDFCVGIGHEDDIFFIFVYAHAEDTIFGKIDILIVEHLLLGIRVYGLDVFPDCFGKEDAHQEIAGCEYGGHHLVVF
jgi:hypothetical protein